MRNLRKEMDGIYNVRVGADITATIAEATVLSAEEKRPIAFEFNGVIVTVCSDSNPELIHRDWARAGDDCIPKRIGPYPNPVLTEEEEGRDSRIRAARKRFQNDTYQLERLHENAVRARRKAYNEEVAIILG